MSSSLIPCDIGLQSFPSFHRQYLDLPECSIFLYVGNTVFVSMSGIPTCAYFISYYQSNLPTEKEAIKEKITQVAEYIQLKGLKQWLMTRFRACILIKCKLDIYNISETNN